MSVKSAHVLTAQELEEFQNSLLKITQTERAYQAADDAHRALLRAFQNKYDPGNVSEYEIKTIHVTETGIAVFSRER